MSTLKLVPNWIAGSEISANSGKKFVKLDPTCGEDLCHVTRSDYSDINQAVAAAQKAQIQWAETPGVTRGMVLHKLVHALQENQDEMAAIIAKETGRSLKDAKGEVQGAIAQGLFFSGEGQRLYGRTTTSGIANRQAMTIRQPVGVAGLVVAANTPIANIAWKVFPALISGNGVVLKAAEDAPQTAWFFGKLAHSIDLIPGLLNIIQGYGPEAGAPLVEHNDVGVVSFTGSREVGHIIQNLAGKRLAKVSLELGGKNPMVICDDADLEEAVHWAILSAFSLAGQRCASASRIILFKSIYEKFKKLFVEKVEQLKIGVSDMDDLGPLLSEKAVDKVLDALERARNDGAKIVMGGNKIISDPDKASGFYMEPTIVEGAAIDAEISRTELFGPVTCLYTVDNFNEALAMANDSPFGLTACIHTANVDRAMQFSQEVQAGVVLINAGTFGSEPHMPFGGVKGSGNGSREPGTEALDLYTNIKNMFWNIRPDHC